MSAPRRAEIAASVPDDALTPSLIAVPADDLQNLAAADKVPTSFHLGALEIRPAARAILLGGVNADLGGRAFDLLMALFDAKGEIVSKETLLENVWPGLTVVDSNLKVQLSILRRALGVERWRIKTVSGRGYMLVAHDVISESSASAAPVPVNKVDSPLVIVVDGDRGTQELVMRALSGITKCLDGAARLALYPGNLDDFLFA